MKKKNENMLMLITGIIAGASTVYFLKSEKGKEIVDQLIETGSELKSTLTKKSNTLLDQGQSLVDSVIDSSSDLATEAKNKAVEVGEDIKESVDDSISDFQKGVNRAKKELSQV